MMDTSLLKRLGNIDQIAGIRRQTTEEGLRTIEVYNAAGLRYTLVADRALDLYDLSYKGVNLSFHTKNGLHAGRNYTPLGAEFFHYWSAGMLSTCGLSSVGAGCADESGAHPIHGRIGQTPATNLCTCARWENGDYLLLVSGDVAETRLYGRHLLLSRRIETSLTAKSVRLTDELTNMGGADEEFMLLYHFNLGHPMLSEHSRFFSSPLELSQTAGVIADPFRIEAPSNDAREQMYVHRTTTRACVAGVLNDELELGFYLEFQTEPLPMLLEWKHFRSHDYVLGIEPCNCNCMGRCLEREHGTLPVIGAYQTIRYDLTLGIADGRAEMEALEQRARG